MCILEFLWAVSITLDAFHNWINKSILYFLHSVGSGSWVTEGVRTTNSTMVGNVTSVRCLSTHLTSFAVLVDVAGGLQVCAGCHSIVATALYNLYNFVWHAGYTRTSLPCCMTLLFFFFFLVGNIKSRAQSLADSFIHWMCHLYNLPHHFCSVLHTARVSWRKIHSVVLNISTWIHLFEWTTGVITRQFS